MELYSARLFYSLGRITHFLYGAELATRSLRGNKGCWMINAKEENGDNNNEPLIHFDKDDKSRTAPPLRNNAGHKLELQGFACRRVRVATEFPRPLEKGDTRRPWLQGIIISRVERFWEAFNSRAYFSLD